MPGKLIIEPILVFCIIHIIKLYRKKLCTVFIDLEIACNSVPREVLKWALIKKRLPKVYKNLIGDMYERANIKARILVLE